MLYFRLTDGDISFEVQPNPRGLNATGLANLASKYSLDCISSEITIGIKEVLLYCMM